MKPDLSSIIILYDYFYPAYKAGGPIQSLTNLVVSLHKEYEISFLTSGYDLNTENPLDGIRINTWSNVLLPHSSFSIPVWYAGSKNPSRTVILNCLKDKQPAVVYLNGMFSLRFLIIPLLCINKKKAKVVICPRGMLQQGALAGKTLKKKLYISALKVSGLLKGVSWHATNEEEQEDIKKVFGKRSKIVIAKNIPRKPVSVINKSTKVPGVLRLVFLSLITQKKNLLQLIDIVSKVQGNISLDIYGPVKDEQYWKTCQLAIEKNSDKITYKGEVIPENVQEIFGQYDASILLTKGENFGHALYESLSAGRPIITSNFTPWNQLQLKKAGWNVDISNNEECIKTLQSIVAMNAESFDEYCKGAYEIATTYYEQAADISNYNKLFSKEDL